MQRTLVALWFADIVGYSAHSAEDESGALRLVEILQALSREIVPRYNGRVVKFVGDAVLAEFPSAELAVRAAAVLSNEYREQSVVSGRAHDLRVGVHLADVAVAADGDLYGDGVNAAARIQEAAEPGRVMISEDVWRQLRSRQEFQFQHLGERSLKGIGSIGLYVVNVENDATRPPPSSITSDTKSVEERKQEIRTVAVLPFADLSAERDQEFFGDGVAEEILNALAKISGIRVPARSSCFVFRRPETASASPFNSSTLAMATSCGPSDSIARSMIFSRSRMRSRAVLLMRWVSHLPNAKSAICLNGRRPTSRPTNSICADGSFSRNGRAKASGLRERCSSERLRLIQISRAPGLGWPRRMCTSLAATASRI